MVTPIRYIKCGGSYQLVEDYIVQTSLRGTITVSTPFLRLTTEGLLSIFAGYCWDGCSGPVIDRKSNMRAGLGHDAVYELMRRKLVPRHLHTIADADFGDTLLQDGAWAIAVKIDLAGLKIANGKYAHPRMRKLRHTAP